MRLCVLTSVEDDITVLSTVCKYMPVCLFGDGKSSLPWKYAHVLSPLIKIGGWGGGGWGGGGVLPFFLSFFPSSSSLSFRVF